MRLNKGLLYSYINFIIDFPNGVFTYPRYKHQTGKRLKEVAQLKQGISSWNPTADSQYDLYMFEINFSPALTLYWHPHRLCSHKMNEDGKEIIFHSLIITLCMELGVHTASRPTDSEHELL